MVVDIVAAVHTHKQSCLVMRNEEELESKEEKGAGPGVDTGRPITRVGAAGVGDAELGRSRCYIKGKDDRRFRVPEVLCPSFS